MHWNYLCKAIWDVCRTPWGTSGAAGGAGEAQAGGAGEAIAGGAGEAQAGGAGEALAGGAGEALAGGAGEALSLLMQLNRFLTAASILCSSDYFWEIRLDSQVHFGYQYR